MIQKIIEFSAHNRVLVLLGVAALCVLAVYTLKEIRLDALPDLSDTQVIVYSRWDRSPDIIEDQVTYPIVTALLGAPQVKAIRGFSDFGFSYVYVIFEDGTDLYWARSRVLEYLSKIQPRLPEGVQTELGPDATGVGWVFQYALVDRSRRRTRSTSCAPTRTGRCATRCSRCPAWPRSPRSAASSSSTRSPSTRTGSPPTASRSTWSIAAVRGSNNEVGGRLLEWSGAEYMVRGRGYARAVADFEQIVVKVGARRRAGAAARRRPGRARARRSGAASPTSTASATPSAASSSCATARTRSTSSSGSRRSCTEIEPSLPEGRRGRHDLRPLRPHRPRHRHAEARADHRDDHRLARDPDLPLAHPVGDRADRHHPDLGAAGVHPAATSWA